MKINEIVKKEDPGLYVSVDFDNKTKDMLETFIERYQIPNGVPRDKLHTTVVYSREWIPFQPAAINIKINPKTYKWKMFGDNKNVLVLTFKSTTLQKRWKEAISQGATYDFDEYIPHVTLSYNAEGFNINNLPLPKFPLRIIKEEHSILDPDSVNDED